MAVVKRGNDPGWSPAIIEDGHGDQVDELLTIDQLRVGDKLGPLTYLLDPAVVKGFADIVEDTNSWYTGESPFGGPVAPAAIPAHDALRLRRQNFMVYAGIHSRHETEFFNPPRLGKRITVNGLIVDKHVKKGREYWAVESESVDEDGVKICRTRYTEAIKMARTKVELKDVDEQLTEQIRPLSSPVAIKMVKSADDIPPRIPLAKDVFKKRIALCQAWHLARRHGSSMAVGVEDSGCALGSLAVGFEEALPFYTEGNLPAKSYVSSKEAGLRSEAALTKLPYGEYKYMVVAPLNRANFEPDVILIYCNPAQAERLVTSALWKEGGALTSKFEGRGACADIIAETMTNKGCQVALGCYLDRVIGKTDDSEMAFAIPFSKLGEIMTGMEATHRAGIRYPIMSWLDYEPAVSPTFKKLEGMWAELGEQQGVEPMAEGKPVVAPSGPKDAPVGYRLPEISRTVTAESMIGFSGPAKNIHTDLERAQQNGFPRRLVAATQPYAFCLESLTNFFGVDWFKTGRMEAVFPGNMFEDDVAIVRGSIKEKKVEESGTRITVDIWVTQQNDRPVLVGEASCLVP